MEVGIIPAISPPARVRQPVHCPSSQFRPSSTYVTPNPIEKQNKNNPSRKQREKESKSSIYPYKKATGSGLDPSKLVVQPWRVASLVLAVRQQ
uniref:Uncharacterized protein n=1 Tax=Arundo donax TaxID=35708 RepID=A0A0A8ZPW3_ARUDO